MKEFSRPQRISQEMQKKIAFIIQQKIKDPRINTMITISGVEISRDLAYSKVFVTFFLLKDENSDSIKEGIKVLQDASGYIRMLLGEKMRLRIVPKLTFFYDNSLIRGMRISSLVDHVVKKDAKRHILETRGK